MDWKRPWVEFRELTGFSAIAFVRYVMMFFFETCCGAEKRKNDESTC